MIHVAVKTDAIKRALHAYAERLEDEAYEAMSAALLASGREALTAIRRQTHRRTGRLESGTKISQSTAYTGRLFSSAPYAGYVDAGTRPHTIAARNARSLSFEIGGRRIFRRSVRHPGTAPRPFAEPAARMGESVLRQRLQEGADRAADAFNR